MASVKKTVLSIILLDIIVAVWAFLRGWPYDSVIILVMLVTCLMGVFANIRSSKCDCD
jgi:hypothetical protein